MPTRTWREVQAVAALQARVLAQQVHALQQLGDVARLGQVAGQQGGRCSRVSREAAARGLLAPAACARQPKHLVKFLNTLCWHRSPVHTSVMCTPAHLDLLVSRLARRQAVAAPRQLGRLHWAEGGSNLVDPRATHKVAAAARLS